MKQRALWRRGGWKRQTTAYIMAFPALFFFVLYLIYPLVIAFRMSLYDYTGIGPLTDFVGWANYKEAISNSSFIGALRNNFVLMGVEFIVSTVLAFGLAYLLFRGIFGWHVFNVILFLPYIIPLSVSAVIWSLIYEPTIGLLNQLLGELGLTALQHTWLGGTSTALGSVIGVWVWRTLPFNLIILFGAMIKIPGELLEAARIDGASGMRIVRNIIFPLTIPTIALLAVISIANDFRAFDIVWIMTQGGPAGLTEIASSFVYKVGFQENHYGYANAVAFLVFVVVIVFVALIALLQRRSFSSEKGESR
ncbi:carbohydrate ABC transporter permease [Cohnella silvisoli]|uniref:Sugar ABC transporter permease n=1 Tax=Cohnella silvisoli TaxID=2873699 RepID=A0ABV1L252_9BACL|nr:sugar ABC transporter permease [Cohnella silvisoli]MCD9025715.1 sugar ABC transporter permease [Cohnella silvisoli]